MRCLTSPLLALLLGIAGCAPSVVHDTPAKPPAPSRIIDTHIHLYDPTRPQGVPWPDAKSPLHRPHLPADFHAVADPLGVGGAVVVEASAWPEDNQWLLDITRNDPAILAIIGNLRLGDAAFARNLRHFAKDPRFRGIRPPFAGKLSLTDPATLADLRLLEELGLSLDLLVNTAMIEQVALAAPRVPKLRIVINHLGGASPARKMDDAWLAAMRAAAKHPNVFCKVSSLDFKPEPPATALQAYTPLLDELYAAFGPDRLMFGSNWPVIDLKGDCATQQALVLAYLAPKGQAVVDQVFWRTAAKVYGVR